MITAGRCFVLLGLIALAHAAYSAIQHRKYLKLTGIQYDSLPSDIFWQTVIGFLVTIVGVVCIAGDFLPINSTTSSLNSSWDSFGNRASFYNFNHRPSLVAGLRFKE